MHKLILHVKVSATDGNDYCFYYNGDLNRYDLLDAIKEGKRIQTCDEFGDESVLTSFVVQNIIRINVKRVDVKVKPSIKEEVQTIEDNDLVLAETMLGFIDDFANILGVSNDSEEEIEPSTTTTEQQEILNWVDHSYQSPKQ